MRAMKREYGPKKGKSVFYASRNKGTISGVEKSKSRTLKKRMGDFFRAGGKKVPYRNDQQKNGTYPKP
jgi:hypothetical protein